MSHVSPPFTCTLYFGRFYFVFITALNPVSVFVFCCSFLPKTGGPAEGNRINLGTPELPLPLSLSLPLSLWHHLSVYYLPYSAYSC